MKKVILPEKHIFRRFFFLQQVNITGMQLYRKRERSFIKFPVLSFTSGFIQETSAFA